MTTAAPADPPRSYLLHTLSEALCPLIPLLDALAARRPPPLAWVVRWGARGRDPVLEAWERVLRPEHLIEFYELYTDRPFPRGRLELWACKQVARATGLTYVQHRRLLRAAQDDDEGLSLVAMEAIECAALRSRIEPPPPLPELLLRLRIAPA